jgi:aspartate/methionine/tyrosine aminotransferase
MDIEAFGLERWFAEHEHGADFMLAESGIRSLSAQRFDTDPGELGYVIPTNGDPELRAGVAGRYGLDPHEILFTCGTQEANLITFLAILDRGDHAVVVTPTYQSLHAVPDALGSVTRVKLRPPDWTLDVERVRDAIKPETAVVIVNNPNNPTGRYHDEATMQAVYDAAADADAYLLCDEVYRLLAEDPLPPVASFGSYGLSTTSLTKAYGLAGARFGWVAGSSAVIEQAWQWKDYTTISPSIFGQHIAAQALGDQEAEILAENRSLASQNRSIVADFCERNGLEWHVPVGVNGFPTIPEGYEDAREFCLAAVTEQSVVLAPGDLFGYPGRFRIGFGLPTPDLQEGLDRLEKLL